MAIWREIIGLKAARLDFEPMPGRPFRSDVSLRSLPGLVVMQGDISDSRVSRTPDLIADANNAFRIEIRRDGRKTFAQRGRELEIGPGEAVLMSYGELVTADQSSGEFIGLQIPFAELAALVPNVDDAVLRPIPRDTEALRLLISYVDILREHESLATPELRHSVVTHIHDLAALIIGASRDATALAQGRGARAARLRAIKRDIVEHLGRGDLSVNVLAARHGLQPRYIQRLFEQDGTTFSEFMLGQRLSRARRLLADPRQRNSTIAAIAFACGFNDQSYFNRCFRKFFGLTPSDIRNSVRPPN